MHKLPRNGCNIRNATDFGMARDTVAWNTRLPALLRGKPTPLAVSLSPTGYAALYYVEDGVEDYAQKGKCDDAGEHAGIVDHPP